MLLLALMLQAAPIQLVRMPQATIESGTLDESVPVLAALPLARRANAIPAGEGPDLERDLARGYAALREERGATPSPILRTVAGSETPQGFDLLVVPPIEKDSGHSAVVFLHGYGGGSTLECWLVSRAASRVGALTVCPSMSRDGHWASTPGRAILASTLSWLQKKGRTRIVLVGLSNGGVGATTLAREHEAELVGAVAIDGTSDTGPSALPMLVLYGKSDHMASPAHGRAFAKAEPHRRFVALDGDHFLLVHAPDGCAAEIEKFLRSVLR